MSMMKLNILMTLEQVWADNPVMPISDDEIEQVKRTLIETNPWLLGLTTVVSLAHTVLDMLAFKSDITHWRSVKSMEGVSVRSMFWKVKIFPAPRGTRGNNSLLRTQARTPR
mmetsp:Transcript_22631/g.90707  ORF Transcript_22631/g.90707 Transcript_22631/m.90707 type:complete len:112 (+) Transcript_22631:1433-1768(+)